MLMHVPSKNGMPTDTNKHINSKQHTPAATATQLSLSTSKHTDTLQPLIHTATFQKMFCGNSRHRPAAKDTPQKQDTAKLPVQQRSLLLQMPCGPCPTYWSPPWLAEQALHAVLVTDNLPCKCLMWQDGSQLRIYSKPGCLDDGAVLDGGIAHDDHDATLDHVALLLVVNILRDHKQ